MNVLMLLKFQSTCFTVIIVSKHAIDISQHILSLCAIAGPSHTTRRGALSQDPARHGALSDPALRGPLHRTPAAGPLSMQDPADVPLQ
jgi:hypothetical protein